MDPIIILVAAFGVSILTLVSVMFLLARPGVRYQESVEQRVSRLEEGIMRIRGEQDTMIRECLSLLRHLSQERERAG